MPDRRGLDPARIGILLVLRAHLSRHVVGDRRQRADGVADLSLFARLAYLQIEQRRHGAGPWAIEQPLRIGKRVQRLVCGKRGKPQGRDIVAQGRAQSFDLRQLGLGAVERVLVDEALARERAGEREGVFIGRRSGHRGIQQQRRAHW